MSGRSQERGFEGSSSLILELAFLWLGFNLVPSFAESPKQSCNAKLLGHKMGKLIGLMKKARWETAETKSENRDRNSNTAAGERQEQGWQQPQQPPQDRHNRHNLSNEHISKHSNRSIWISEPQQHTQQPQQAKQQQQQQQPHPQWQLHTITTRTDTTQASAIAPRRRRFFSSMPISTLPILQFWRWFLHVFPVGFYKASQGLRSTYLLSWSTFFQLRALPAFRGPWLFCSAASRAWSPTGSVDESLLWFLPMINLVQAKRGWFSSFSLTKRACGDDFLFSRLKQIQVKGPIKQSEETFFGINQRDWLTSLRGELFH